MTAQVDHSGGRTLIQRAMRSSAITVMGFAGSQIIRLASNLLLTRLLFPEAFGVMAMVSVFLMGLAMFSDAGVGPAIMQSKRGDDDDFLNTAWTIQIIRGFLLYSVAVILCWPVSQFYGEPALLYFLPVAALTLIIQGFNPTRLESANRHLLAGRVTVIDIATQLVGIITAVVLAWIFQSVWALVISGLLSMLAQLYFLNRFLPGPSNKLRWEKPAAQELINFGKWVFLSTICGFAISQADKIIIGRFLTTYDFGIYNIGFFLASFPMMLGGVVTHRVVIPIYRESPPNESRANFLHLRKMRTFATATLMFLAAILVVSGVWLVELMYDDRYLPAGGVVVLIALMQIPAIIAITYDQAALAAGDSRSFFVLAATRAVFVIAGLIIGLGMFGLPGALIGQGIALVAAYPVVVWLASKQGAWDPVHDLGFAVLGIGLGLLAFWLHSDALAALSQFSAA